MTAVRSSFWIVDDVTSFKYDLGPKQILHSSIYFVKMLPEFKQTHRGCCVVLCSNGVIPLRSSKMHYCPLLGHEQNNFGFVTKFGHWIDWKNTIIHILWQDDQPTGHLSRDVHQWIQHNCNIHHLERQAMGCIIGLTATEPNAKVDERNHCWFDADLVQSMFTMYDYQ